MTIKKISIYSESNRAIFTTHTFENSNKFNLHGHLIIFFNSLTHLRIFSDSYPYLRFMKIDYRL